ncbi:M23 family metallopeptidase [Alteromonas sp. H39]|uniref:M23 family metallopeptidase n=1 Tax=Alteromonas sp. H39 TaxID=3389876 RepID=UPI0039E0B393
MKVRGCNALVVTLAFLSSMLFSGAMAVASEPSLVLNGKLTQGSLIRGQVPVGSQVSLNGQSLTVNPQGKFVMGFERDAQATHTLRIIAPDGKTHTQTLTISKREYDIQRIDGLDQKMVSPPKSVLERIRNDSANVARARSGNRNYDAVFTRFSWPAEGPITGVYGSQRVLNGEPKRPHYGVDVGGPIGTPIVAPTSGIVTLAEDLYYSGNTVILDHGMGVFSTFLHLDSITVKVGEELNKGEQLGTLGATGRATGPHLDWRINLGSMRLDPQLLITDSE